MLIRIQALICGSFFIIFTNKAIFTMQPPKTTRKDEKSKEKSGISINPFLWANAITRAQEDGSLLLTHQQNDDLLIINPDGTMEQKISPRRRDSYPNGLEDL